MTNNVLDDFVKQAKDQNFSNDEIKSKLLESGWPENDINKALEIPTPSLLIAPKPPQKQGSSMWDAFEHIIMFISLYVTATSVALILHYYVDKFLPGVNNPYSIGSYSDTYGTVVLSGYYSALIVASPVFALLFLRITKKTKTNPETRNLDSRKKLIYATLILTFIIVLCNLSSIIFSLLQGNVTPNFVLHFLVTTSISGVIFIYYLGQVKQDRELA